MKRELTRVIRKIASGIDGSVKMGDNLYRVNFHHFVIIPASILCQSSLGKRERGVSRFGILLDHARKRGARELEIL